MLAACVAFSYVAVMSCLMFDYPTCVSLNIVYIIELLWLSLSTIAIISASLCVTSHLIMDGVANVPAGFAPVAPGTRWDYSWISVDLCREDGTLVWVPEPVDWLLMTPNNVDRLVLGCRHLVLQASDVLGRWKWVFSHEIGGVKVYRHCSRPVVVLVRQVNGPLIINVKRKALNDCVQVDCIGVEGRVFSEWYDLKKPVTIASLRKDLMDHLMLWRSASKYTDVHFFRAGAHEPLAGKTMVWSPRWDNVPWAPRVRVVGKQPYTRQLSLDVYFNNVSL
jgi:hypothetical protein